MAKTKIPFEYRAFVTTIKFLLKCVAIWPASESNFYSRFGPYLYMFTLIFTMFGIFYSMISSSGSIGFLIKTCFWLTGDAGVLFKIMTIHFNRKELKKLYETLVKHYVKLLKDPNFEKKILKGMYCNLLHVLTILYSINLLSYSIPVFDIIRQFISGVHPIQYKIYIPIKYPWYPISTHGFAYSIHCLIVSISCLTFPFATSSCDALFFLYMIKIIGHLRQLTYEMKNFNNNNNDEYHGFTRKIVIRHINVMHYCHQLEKIFGPLVLWFTISNAVFLVGATYMISQLSHMLSFGDRIQFFIFIIIKLFQVYTYGYFGSYLQKESENYSFSIYSVNWLGKKNFMSSIVIMLSQKSLFFNIFNFSVLSVELFVATLNATISYYFLLKTLDN